MKTYLLIETKNVLGRVAYVDTITKNENVLKYNRDKNISSINIFKTKKAAEERADFLNKLYKELE